MPETNPPNPALIPRLTILLQDQSNSQSIRDSSAKALVEIAQKYPEYRGQCIAILTSTLERYPRNPIELNTALIGELIDLKARESAVMIQQVIQAGEYDRQTIGNWHDVARALGVLHPPPPPTPPSAGSVLSSAAAHAAAANLSPNPALAAATIASGPHLTPKQKDKLRAKRKQERKSKKQNRRR